LKIAAKQLQIETWLLMTAYRKLTPPYPTVPSATRYNLPFSHNTAGLVRYDPSRSSKVNGSCVIWYGICYFLLVI